MLGVESADHVTWLRFEREERLNSFTVADYQDLLAALERCIEDDTRVVVLTGAGRAFSVGADKSLLARSTPQADAGDGAGDDAGGAMDGAKESFEALLELLSTYPLPVVAAVNGLSVGLGATVLLHCDLVVAAESARFRFPFTAMGIVPEAASTGLLPQRVRWDDALWSMLSSEWIEAEAAREMGLAWRVVPDDDLVAETAAVAATLAALDPTAVSATKGLLYAGRADAVAAAHQREMVAMRGLFGRRTPADS